MTGSAAIHQPSPDPARRVAFELLFAAARLVLGSEATRTVRALIEQPVDWDVVIALAHEHRVIPLVYRTLSRLDPPRVPEDVLVRLRDEARANSRRNLLVTGELLHVIDLLSEHGIAVLPYKGPVLAATVYGDVSLRQFIDLDVIVHESDIERATGLLPARGYRMARDFTGKDIALFNEAVGVTIEMHWSITAELHPIHVSSERLWKNLRHCTVGGRSVLANATEDLLWILCVHGGQHRWERLSWLCDVAELVRGQKVDWDRTMRSAREVGAGRVLFLGLLLARDLLGAELPSKVVRAIESDRVLYALAEQVKAWLVAPGMGPQALGDFERYYIMLGDRFRDRLRIAFRQAGPYFAPTSREKEILPLPRYLSWMLYVVRPVRLTWNYGLTPLKRFVKGLFEA